MNVFNNFEPKVYVTVLSHIKKIRSDFLASTLQKIDNEWVFTNPCEKENKTRSMISKTKMKEQVEALEKRLGLVSNYNMEKDVQDTTVKIALNNYLFLIQCPTRYSAHFAKNEEDFKKIYFQKQPEKEILLFVNRMSKAKTTPLPMRKAYLELVLYLNGRLNLSIAEITSLTLMSDDDNEVSGKILETPNLSKITNHPVHILDEDGIESPSALIPFCGFGDKMLGIQNSQFNVPVCNIFKEVIFNSQLCYEFDPKDRNFSDLKSGLFFTIDENEDRQVTFEENDVLEESDFLDSINYNAAELQGSRIFIDTIGNI